MDQEESPRRLSVLGGLVAGLVLGTGLVLLAAPSRSARAPLPPRRWRRRARGKRPSRR